MTNGSRLTSITQSGRGLMATRRVTVDLLGQRVELVRLIQPTQPAVRDHRLPESASAASTRWRPGRLVSPQRRWPSLLVKRPGGRIGPRLDLPAARGAGGWGRWPAGQGAAEPHHDPSVGPDDRP